MANPYLHPVGNQWLREGRQSGARALQDLALNRYNGQDWPADMGQVCGMSDEHRDAALSMRMDDRIHGNRTKPSRCSVARLRKRGGPVGMPYKRETAIGSPDRALPAVGCRSSGLAVDGAL